MHLCLRRPPNHQVQRPRDRSIKLLAPEDREVLATKIWDLTVHKILFYCNLRHASHIAVERVPVSILADMQLDADYYAESPEIQLEVMEHIIQHDGRRFQHRSDDGAA